MRPLLLLLCAQLVFIVAFSQTHATTRHLKVITVSGTAYERGFQHGQQLKKEIGELMGLWKSDLEKNIHQPADSFIHTFLTHTNFTAAIKKYTPDLWQEVKGLADGAGQPFDDILAFQLPDEYWVYEDRISHDTVHHHCSGIGVPAMNGHPAYVSQNMDVDAWMDGYQIVLHIKPNPNTPEQFILTCAGLIALNGMNQNGIGVCVNTLMQLNASPNGLPVAFMIRGLLQQKNRNGALHFLQTTPHASGQNYILGTMDSVYDFEASANRIVRLYPDASGLVYHTNHPVVNNDIKPWYQDYYKNFVAGNTQNKNSEVRFATLKKRAAAAPEKDDAFIKAALRSKDDPNNVVCRPHVPNKSFFTFGSVIFTLSGVRTMQVTAGPPDESEYQTFSFKQQPVAIK